MAPEGKVICSRSCSGGMQTPASLQKDVCLFVLEAHIGGLGHSVLKGFIHLRDM